MAEEDAAPQHDLPACSRLCIKNLPKHVTEKRLRDHFTVKGEVTDVKILKTRQGADKESVAGGTASHEQHNIHVAQLLGTWDATAWGMPCLARHSLHGPVTPSKRNNWWCLPCMRALPGMASHVRWASWASSLRRAQRQP